MWELYDELIEGIPRDMTVDLLICGALGTVVKSGGSYGIGGSAEETSRSAILPRKRLGMPLRDLAACVKSWNFIEASAGLAALNAYYNGAERLLTLGVDTTRPLSAEDRESDPFIAYQNDIRDKNVTVIGRFPYLAQLFAPVCNLAVIERFYPDEGDYPEQAADYLLPMSDYVFISSYTLVEKTLPRYLSLSEGAYVTIVGPATTMSPILFKYGVRDLSGFVIKDGAGAENACAGLGGNIHQAGLKICLKSDG